MRNKDRCEQANERRINNLFKTVLYECTTYCSAVILLGKKLASRAHLWVLRLPVKCRRGTSNKGSGFTRCLSPRVSKSSRFLLEVCIVCVREFDVVQRRASYSSAGFLSSCASAAIWCDVCICAGFCSFAVTESGEVCMVFRTCFANGVVSALAADTSAAPTHRHTRVLVEVLVVVVVVAVCRWWWL